MKRFAPTLIPALFLFLLAACTAESPVSPDLTGQDAMPASVQVAAAKGADDKACWGQATAVFAQMGEMGEHARDQQEPRIGLAA